MEPSSSGRPTRSLPEQRSSAEFPPNERVRCPCRDDGGGEIVRFFARLDLGTAFATLIRQRHPMPSCGGLAPTAERTVDPARTIAESLTSDPGIREQNRRSTMAPLLPRPMRWKTFLPMAALAVENERLAADAAGVRNLLAAVEQARGKPYTAEERQKRVAELE